MLLVVQVVVHMVVLMELRITNNAPSQRALPRAVHRAFATGASRAGGARQAGIAG